MALSSSIIRDLIYPAWLLREGQYGILRRIGDIETKALLSPTELRERQLQLLKEMLIHAQESTTHYSRVFSEHGFSADRFNDFAQLKKLPIVSKTEIKLHPQEFRSQQYSSGKDVFESHTGGSTGTPMTFFRDKECLIYRRALDHYLDRTIGFRIGEKQALLWGNPSDLPFVQTARQKLMEMLVWHRISHLPLILDDRELADFAMRMLRFKPRLFKAYPSLLYYFCEFLKRQELESIQVPIVVTTAEQLFDFQRETALARLGCELFEKYGSREIGTAAIECRQHDGLHLITESLYVEVEPVPGYDNLGVGKLIVTDLRNRAMPLIRYEVGDLAAYDDSPCGCGLPFPRLKNIQGRASDILYRRDGAPIAGLESTDAITYSGLSTQAQIVQNEPGVIEVRIVNLNDVASEQISYIRKRLLQMLGENGDVNFVDVDVIERDKSGKFRYVLSNVPSR